MTVTDWALNLGIKPNTLARRIRAGWPTDKALAQPVRKSKGAFNKKGSPKLTNSAVLDIKSRIGSGETLSSIAKHYNVNTCTIGCIARGKTWGRVQPVGDAA